MNSYQKLRRSQAKQSNNLFGNIGQFLDTVGPTGFLRGTGRAMDRAFGNSGPGPVPGPPAPPTSQPMPTEPGRAGFGLESTRPAAPASGGTAPPTDRMQILPKGTQPNPATPSLTPRPPGQGGVPYPPTPKAPPATPPPPPSRGSLAPSGGMTGNPMLSNSGMGSGSNPLHSSVTSLGSGHGGGMGGPLKMSAVGLSRLHVMATRLKQSGHYKESEGDAASIPAQVMAFLQANPNLRNTLIGGGIGAGGGALLGGLSAFNQDEEERNMLGSALTGAMSGGLLGAGAGYAGPQIYDWLKGKQGPAKTPPPAEAVIQQMQGHKPVELPKDPATGAPVTDVEQIVESMRGRGFDSSKVIGPETADLLLKSYGEEGYRAILDGLDTSPSAYSGVGDFLDKSYLSPGGVGTMATGAGLYGSGALAGRNAAIEAGAEQMSGKGGPRPYTSLQGAAENIDTQSAGPWTRMRRAAKSYNPLGREPADLAQLARKGRGLKDFSTSVGKVRRLGGGLLSAFGPMALEGIKYLRAGQ